MEDQTKNKNEDKSSSAPDKREVDSSVQGNQDGQPTDVPNEKEADDDSAPKIKPIKGSVDEWSVTWP